jgi:hypothetical protein
LGLYVGKLYQVEAGGELYAVEPVAIGVDDDLGLVSGPTRSAITCGDYYSHPRTGNEYPCTKLWYERSRKGYSGQNWYHDLDQGAYVVIDQTNAPPFVWFDAPDVQICKMTGAFLCG